MQIRCSNCHRPYGLNKEQVHAALDLLDAEDMGHYNATCPHCRRVNRVSRSELLRAAPDWARQASEENAAQEERVVEEEDVTPKEQAE
jgi:phage FluMu protein Com